ncbi:MAG: M48 family metallopeptidase [Betaproteobacteria bacterium]|nr:M48 family metallopeptidase [Betaproteobacteria bacterium]
MLRRLLALALCAALLPVHGQGLPDLGDVSDATLSEKQERTIGSRVMREIRVDPAFVEDPEIADYVKTLGNRLLSAADSPGRAIEFFVVRDDAVNAFALIGGHIGIHTGLFLLTENESELAGVVGHEIAHILQRHQSRLYQSQGRYQLASLAALALALLASRGSSSQSGQVTEAALVSASAIAIQGQLDYTREHEREADRVGITILERAGYDPRGMVSFFERMQRANRLSEFKGAPSYLRTHPLTIERISDMQNRAERMPVRLVPDSFEYRLARAKVRAESGQVAETVAWFRNRLADKTVLRPREDSYGLALALLRARDFPAAEKELALLRSSAQPHPAFEQAWARLLTERGMNAEAVAAYRVAIKAFPAHRGLAYGLADLLIQSGDPKAALALLEERVRATPEDARLHELTAKAYAASGRPLSQHRAQAEAYYRRGNLAAAVAQLEIASKSKPAAGADFYDLSSAEARLRELRNQLEIEREAEKALKIS